MPVRRFINAGILYFVIAITIVRVYWLSPIALVKLFGEFVTRVLQPRRVNDYTRNSVSLYCLLLFHLRVRHTSITHTVYMRIK